MSLTGWRGAIRSATRLEGRAARLARWYPRRWRERYGEEFVALLVDDMAERPVALGRFVDVVRHGVGARLEESGLAGRSASPEKQLSAGLALVGIAIAVFFATGVALWSQLTIGWQWAQPREPATVTAMWLMSGALLFAVPLLLAAAAPLGVALLSALRAGHRREFVRPLIVATWGATVLVLGSRHFGPQWPGTGGHWWSARGLVPVPVAKIMWAGTSWFTTYWLHPGTLSQFPGDQLAWMALSPFALGATLTAGAIIVGRLRLSRAALRFETLIAALACVATAAFLAGASSWVLDGDSGSYTPFRVGVIDYCAVALMCIALIAACAGARRAACAGPRR